MDPCSEISSSTQFLLDEIRRLFAESDARFDRLTARMRTRASSCIDDSGAVSVDALISSTNPATPLDADQMIRVSELETEPERLLDPSSDRVPVENTLAANPVADVDTPLDHLATRTLLNSGELVDAPVPDKKLDMDAQAPPTTGTEVLKYVVAPSSADAIRPSTAPGSNRPPPHVRLAAHAGSVLGPTCRHRGRGPRRRQRPPQFRVRGCRTRLRARARHRPHRPRGAHPPRRPRRATRHTFQHRNRGPRRRCRRRPPRFLVRDGCPRTRASAQNRRLPRARPLRRRLLRPLPTGLFEQPDRSLEGRLHDIDWLVDEPAATVTTSPPTLLQAPSTSAITMEYATSAAAPPLSISIEPRTLRHGTLVKCLIKCPGDALSTVRVFPVAKGLDINSISAAGTYTAIGVVDVKPFRLQPCPPSPMQVEFMCGSPDTRPLPWPSFILSRHCSKSWVVSWKPPWPLKCRQDKRIVLLANSQLCDISDDSKCLVKEKEMASLYGNVISSTQIRLSFVLLLEDIDDLAVDIPDVVDVLALFIAQAVVDGILKVQPVGGIGGLSQVQCANSWLNHSDLQLFRSIKVQATVKLFSLLVAESIACLVDLCGVFICSAIQLARSTLDQLGFHMPIQLTSALLCSYMLVSEVPTIAMIHIQDGAGGSSNIFRVAGNITYQLLFYSLMIDNP